ncbi:hypothetical protein R3P38DRAFT_3169529 [Favolaschia claudopus]|uniref:Uncharacterized protein n=1 Tax=Favolaschia claudopus TaxID=2862362 RepID=A0AAW0E2J0_9AGAR
MILSRRSNSADAVLAGLDLTRPNHPFFFPPTTFPTFTLKNFLASGSPFFSPHLASSPPQQLFSSSRPRRQCVDYTHCRPASGTSQFGRRQANPRPRRVKRRVPPPFNVFLVVVVAAAPRSGAKATHRSFSCRQADPAPRHIKQRLLRPPRQISVVAVATAHSSDYTDRRPASGTSRV